MFPHATAGKQLSVLQQQQFVAVPIGAYKPSERHMFELQFKRNTS
jgi:hypothetical protein